MVLIIRQIKNSFLLGKKYAPYNKGGIFRKWYGNLEYVIKFDNENYKKLLNQGNHLPSRYYYFKKGITWSLFGFENFGVRYKDFGYVFDVSGSSMFPKEEDILYIIGYLCSNVCFNFLSCLAPTVNFQVGNIASLPLIITNDLRKKEHINKLVKENIEICKEEWSFYETNYEFISHPFVMKKFKNDTLEKTLDLFEKYYNDIREKLRKNEEELNQIYAKIFKLNEEIDYSVKDRDLTIKPFNKVEWIKSFLSYIVGCSAGRFNYEKCTSNYEKNIYTINLDYLINYSKLFLTEVFNKDNLLENIDYIKMILNIESLENYYKNDFIKNHNKQYLKYQLYYIK